MGICYWDARTLWDARRAGASFRETLTIGRQALNLHPGEVGSLRRAWREEFPGGADGLFQGYRFYDFADDFLRRFLGAESVSVMDYSDYEGADLVHDLNQPVPAALHGRYDAVIDGGSLEHVFNFPVAVSNLMNMTRVGGRIFLTLPANNLCGHGFYQFSPELMFRVFAASNGFKVERAILWEAEYPSVELTPAGRAHEVSDPDVMRRRVGLMSRGPVTMIVEASKLAAVPLFASPPLQSDYAAQWEVARSAQAAVPAVTGVPFHKALLKRAWNRLPYFLRLRIKGFRERREFSFSNRDFYKPL
jgi:hypothetical protein